MPKGEVFIRKGKQRIKFNAHYGMPDYFKYYLDNQEDNNIHTVDRGKFYDIVSDFHELLVQKILHEGLMVPLPHNFGYLGVKKQKIPFHVKNRLKLDYKHYKSTGQKVLHTNDHTGHYFYKIMWRKSRTTIPTKRLYNFLPARYFKRTLAKLIKEKLVEYPENLKVKLTNEQAFAYNQMHKARKDEIKRLVQEYKDKHNI